MIIDFLFIFCVHSQPSVSDWHHRSSAMKVVIDACWWARYFTSTMPGGSRIPPLASTSAYISWQGKSCAIFFWGTENCHSWKAEGESLKLGEQTQDSWVTLENCLHLCSNRLHHDILQWFPKPISIPHAPMAPPSPSCQDWWQDQWRPKHRRATHHVLGCRWRWDACIPPQMVANFT